MKDLRHLTLRFAQPILAPLVGWYLSKARNLTYKDIKIKVFPGVFHPGLFFSTKYLLSFLENEQIENKTLLELGAGTGLISIFAAKKGAHVTASDISEIAIHNIEHNKVTNSVKIKLIRSDLFDAFPPAPPFDILVINPPYYPKNPLIERDFSWFCGENFEYFHKLFRQLPEFIHKDSRVLMILSEDCDIERIKGIAGNYKFSVFVLSKRKIWGEMNYIYQWAIQEA